MTKENIICDDCAVDFTIEYNKVEELQYCPFCGCDLLSMDEEDEEDEDSIEDYWGDEE